jgi:hypothetical protein
VTEGFLSGISPGFRSFSPALCNTPTSDLHGGAFADAAVFRFARHEAQSSSSVFVGVMKGLEGEQAGVVYDKGGVDVRSLSSGYDRWGHGE